MRRLVPVLRWLERFIRPRWATPFEATKRGVGGVVLLLSASLLAPVPLSNVPPALAIMLIAFAYLEEDGVLLCAGLVRGRRHARRRGGRRVGNGERDRLGAEPAVDSSAVGLSGAEMSGAAASRHTEGR